MLITSSTWCFTIRSILPSSINYMIVHWTNTWQPEIYEPQGSYISGYTITSYNVLSIDINEQYLEETLGEDLGVDLVKAIQEE